MYKKRKIVIVLFVATFLLLLTDLLVKTIFTEKKVTVKTFYPNEVNRIFISCLNDFGIEESNIKVKKLKVKGVDTAITNYLINTPKDLRMVEFISSLNELLYFNGVVISGKELIINKDSEIILENNGNILFAAKFVYNEKFIRTENRFSIIVDGIEDLNNDELEILLDTPADICFTILPSTNGEHLLEKIIKHGKYYAIEIDDNVDDPFYIMNEDQHPEKIIKSLSQVLKKFSHTNFIVLNDKSEFYKSSKFKFITKNIPSGFISKKVTELINLGDREPAELVSLFKFYAEKKESIKKYFFFTTKQFFIIKEEMLRLKKKGNNILPPYKLYELNY